MKSLAAIALSAALLFSSASAQDCQQNITMDDFKKNPQPRKFFDGADRYINLLGGDYGGDNVTMNFDNVADGYMTVTPTQATNFFFFKANEQACYDLRKFTALHWDMEAPAGAESDLTLTVMHANCTTRDDTGDSSYKIVTPYTAGKATNGQKQTFVAPMADFGVNTRGQAYDFQHFKDFTFVNMKPVNTAFKFYFFEMVGDCTAVPGTKATQTGSINQPTSSATSKPSSGVVDAKASGLAAAFFTLLGAFAALF